MLLQGNFKSKYTKHILRLALLVAVLAVIFLELGIISIGQVNFSNVYSIYNANNPLEPPKECLYKNKDGYGWSCFRPYFETLTNEVSANAAMAEAIRLKVEGTTSECHLFAHFIGEANLEKHNFDMGKAFSSCTSGCNDGCFHGVMERSIRNETDPSNVIPKIKNVCDSLGTDGRQKYRCIHGTGHGLLAHDYLPLRDAINACNTFGPDWASACIGGLTMENMSEYRDLDLDEDNLRKILPEICAPFESMEPAVLHRCVVQITLGLLDYTGYNIERTEKLCEELQRQDYISVCKKRIPYWVGLQRPSNIDAIKFFENRRVF